MSCYQAESRRLCHRFDFLAEVLTGDDIGVTFFLMS